MILICPHCTMSHVLPNGVLGPDGREVSCQRCRLTWFAEPAPVSAVSIKNAIGPRAEKTPARKKSRSLPIVCCVLVCAGLMAGIGYRRAIVHYWPAGKTLFAMAGLPVQRTGLALRNVKSVLLTDGPRHVLAITGEIDNGRDIGRGVPKMRLSLRGADGRDIYSWDATAPKSRLDAGETIAFRSRLAAPPEGAHDVVVRFADN